MNKFTQLWCEAHFQVKMYKAHHSGSTSGSWDDEKVHAVLARSTFRSQTTFGSWDVEKVYAVVARSTHVVLRGRRKGFCTLSKVSKTWGCSSFKSVGRCGTFEEDLQRCMSRGSTVNRWNGKNAKLIGTRPSALHSTFHFEGSLAELLRFWCCQLRKLRKSRRIASFLMLSTSKIEEVSQNCFVFDVVKFKNWSLAE